MYKIGDKVLIRRGNKSLDEVTIINVIDKPFKKRYIVGETYRHAIEGIKTEYMEIKPKEIVCKKEVVNQ